MSILGADEPMDEEGSLHFIAAHDASGLLPELETAEIILTSVTFDAADKARTSHWQRFLLRVASLMDSNPGLKVGDVLSMMSLKKSIRRLRTRTSCCSEPRRTVTGQLFNASRCWVAGGNRDSGDVGRLPTEEPFQHLPTIVVSSALLAGIIAKQAGRSTQHIP